MKLPHFLLLLISCMALGQEPNFQLLNRSITVEDPDIYNSIILGAREYNQEIYYVGSTGVYTQFSYIFVGKINSLGEQEWLTYIDNDFDENKNIYRNNQFTIDAEGNLLVVFSKWDESTGSLINNGDYNLVKLDQGGNILWSYRSENIIREINSFIEIAQDGNYLCVSNTEDESGVADIQIEKLNPSGEVLWSSTNFVDGDYYLISKTAIAQPNGDLYIGGSYCYNVPNIILDTIIINYTYTCDTYLLKTDSMGNKLWDRRYDVADNNGHGFFHAVNDTTLLLSTLMRNIDYFLPLGQLDYPYIATYDSSGTLINERSYYMDPVTGGNPALLSVVIDTSSNSMYGVTSKLEVNPGHPAKAWLWKVDIATLDTLWTKTIIADPEIYTEFHDIQLTCDGGLLGAASTDPPNDVPNPLPQIGWVCKMGPNGEYCDGWDCMDSILISNLAGTCSPQDTISSLVEELLGLKIDFKVYPSLIQRGNSVAFSLSQPLPSNLAWSLYDVNGLVHRSVRIPANQTSGNITLNYQPSGIYFWTLSNGSQKLANGQLIVE
jgi:hypothetical protein